MLMPQVSNELYKPPLQEDETPTCISVVLLRTWKICAQCSRKKIVWKSSALLMDTLTSSRCFSRWNLCHIPSIVWALDSINGWAWGALKIRQLSHSAFCRGVGFVAYIADLFQTRLALTLAKPMTTLECKNNFQAFSWQTRHWLAQQLPPANHSGG